METYGNSRCFHELKAIDRAQNVCMIKYRLASFALMAHELDVGDVVYHPYLQRLRFSTVDISATERVQTPITVYYKFF